MKPITWNLQTTQRPKGAYIQAVYGRPPGRRRAVTLGYLEADDAAQQLANLRLLGARLTTVVLPDGSLVPFDDLRAPEGRPIYDDDSIRLAARCAGVGDDPRSFDEICAGLEVREAVSSGDLAKLQLSAFYEHVFLPVRRREVSPGTVKREHQLWGTILPVLGGLPLRKVDGIQIERFLLSRETWGGAARRLAMAAIRALLTYAVDLSVLPELPRLRPIKGSTKRSLPRPVALLPEQVSLILDAASTPAHRALYATAIGQGLRPAEASSIQWGDVDWAEGRLHVRGTKTELSDRVIPLTPATASELRPFWEAQGRPQAGPAFTYRGKPIHEWKGSFARAAQRAGLTDLRVYPYLARHTFATSCALSGVPKAAAKEMLGHSEKSEMLEKAYTNPAFSQIAEAMQRLTRLGG